MPNKIEYDLLLVGGGPSSFALAHHLVDLASKSKLKLRIAIFEKGKEFGTHIVSGAVSNLRVIQKLFPDYRTSDFPMEGICTESFFSVLGDEKKWDVPHILLPSGLKKEGCAILTLSHVVYWMYSKLKEKVQKVPNVQIDFFNGFSAHKVIFEGEKVVGVQVIEESSKNVLDNIAYAKVTCFGDKGFISRDVIDKFKLRDNPQIWSIGVKELWQLNPSKDYSGKVWHTFGFPLIDGSFGGGFVYGMKDNKLTIGMVISLDSENPNINPQQRLQDFKKHPWVQEMICDGKMLKYGGAVLPEGGYYSLPKQFTVDGAVLLGDALGVLDIERLSGIDKGMESGYQAAEVLHEAFTLNDFSNKQLSKYKEKIMNTFIGKELKSGRYFRYAWQENKKLLNNYLPKVMHSIDKSHPYLGLLSIGLTSNPFLAIYDGIKLKYLMDGFEAGHVKYKLDHQNIVPNFRPKEEIKTNNYTKDTIYSRADAVFYAKTKYHEGNNHIDEFKADVCVKCISTYDKLGKDTPCVSDCTAEVHRVDITNGLRVHGMSLENCIQCRTCEIVCPEINLRVRPTAQGSGPDFMGL